MGSDVPSGLRKIEAQNFCRAVVDGTHASPKESAAGRLLVTSKHIKGGRVDLSNAYRISEADFQEINKRSRVDQWDVIFTMIGTVGESALVVDEAPNFTIKNVGLFKNRDELSGRWLYYFLRTPEARAELERRKRGSTQQYISLGDLRSFPLWVPLESETTESIVSILQSLDDRINLLRQTNATLEAIAQALFKSWFVDFDPVHAKAEGRDQEAMDAATAALFPSEFEESELGLIPKGWRTIPFGKLLRQSVGGDWGKEASDAEYVSRMAIVRGTDIPDLKSSSPLRVPVRFTTPRKLSSRALASGDLVIEVSGGSKDQPTGRSIYVTQALLDLFDCPVVPASFCRRFCPISREIGLLLAEHLSYIYAAGRTWDYQNQSTGISNFQTKYFLSNELVVIPTDEVLSAFTKTIGPIAERTQLHQSRRLADLRDTLLPRLISGKLRLPEATEVAETALA